MRKGSLLAVLVVAGSAIGGCAHEDASSSRMFASNLPAESQWTAPAGREATVRLDRPVGTDMSFAGEAFTGRLTAPLVATDGSVLAQPGAVLHGTVVSISTRPSSVTIRFDTLQTMTWQAPIDAVVIEVRDPDVALQGGLHAADEARFSTLTRKADLLERPVAHDINGGVDESEGMPLRIPVTAEIRLMLTSPLRAPAAR